jgi:glycosyltransferase involved in cell wall biosynthesis
LWKIEREMNVGSRAAAVAVFLALAVLSLTETASGIPFDVGRDGNIFVSFGSEGETERIMRNMEIGNEVLLRSEGRVFGVKRLGGEMLGVVEQDHLVDAINKDFEGQVIVVVDGLGCGGESAGKFIRNIKRSVRVCTVLRARMWVLSVKEILIGRGLGMQSTYVIVDNRASEENLVGSCGVSPSKVRRLRALDVGDMELKMLLIKNRYVKDVEISALPLKKKRALVSGATVKTFLGKKKRCGDGVFVLYSDPYIHVNGEFREGKLFSVAVRVSREEQKFEGTKSGVVPSRGNVNERTEEYVYADSRGTMEIYKERAGGVRTSKGRILIITPNVDVVVRRGMPSVIAEARGMGRAHGVLVGRGDPEAWRVRRTKNRFFVGHRRLKRRVGGGVGTVYRTPRRQAVEPFEGKNEMREMKVVVVRGDMDLSGFGCVNKSMILSLQKYPDILVFVEPVNKKRGGMEDFDGYLVSSVYMSEVGRHVGKRGRKIDVIRKRSRWKPVELRNSYPPITHPPRNGFELVIQFPWEFTAVPISIAEGLKRPGTHVWTPSSFCMKVLTKAGIPRNKLSRVPHGTGSVEAGIFVRMRGIRRKKSPVTFVVVGGSLRRKGIDVTIKAYRKAFKGKEGVILRIHSMYGDFGSTAEIMELVSENMRAGGPKISFTRGVLEREKVRRMVASAHFLVSSFRGEGFGLPILDAMSYGTVPIATNYASARDICSSKCALLIPCRETKCDLRDGKRGQAFINGVPATGVPMWAEPSEDALADILKQARDMVASGSGRYKELSRMSRVVARKKSWEAEMRKAKRFLAFKK